MKTQNITSKQDELAEAIAKGICKYLGVEYKFIEDNDNTEDIPVIDENTFIELYVVHLIIEFMQKKD